MDATGALAVAIGDRIRYERQARRWTLDQLAQAADVSRRMLVNLEQGAANPSIGILLKISDALGVGLPALVESPEPAALEVTRSGAGAVLWTGDAGGRGVLVAGTAPPNVVELWDWTLGVGDRYVSAPHAAGTKELMQVHKGSVHVEVAGQSVSLAVGDAFGFPGDAPHVYANGGSKPARFSLAVFEPGVGVSARAGAGDA